MKLTMHLLKYFGLAILFGLLAAAVIGCDDDGTGGMCKTCDFNPYDSVVIYDESGHNGRSGMADANGCVKHECGRIVRRPLLE
jgi:hypothetical protein